MCYACTQCGKCGKFDVNSPMYVPPATIPCLKCGAEVNQQTGRCDTCGHQAFVPMGEKSSAGA